MLTLVLACAVLAQADDVDPRRESLEVHRRIVTPAKEWETWLSETGELPPDWGEMPVLADLPGALSRWEGGRWVTIDEARQWPDHREKLLEQFKYWVIGSYPDPPGEIQAVPVDSSAEANGTRREFELRFGPDKRARLWVQLLIPPGEGPFPVFMTQENHKAWARIAMRRGYLGVVYAGADSRDDTATFIDAYPGYDWSKLTRRAWAAGRCIDFLEQQVPLANTDQVALTGHSRNGKLSLIASAIDERIGVVISSSSGTGGPIPSRIHSEQHFTEGIENITRSFPDWFHPRWRFFVGREHQMPVDMHQLTALTAPRACLLSTAINDGVEATWGIEQAYHAIKPAYALHDAEDKLRILYREGDHETTPTTIEQYIDWCDVQFGRGSYEFPETLIHPWDWNAWNEGSGGVGLDDLPKKLPAIGASSKTANSEQLSEAVRWILGDAPARVQSGVESYGLERDYKESLLRRDSLPKGLERDDIMFGDYLNADIYMPEGFKEDRERHPAVIWLHTWSFAKGYVPAYRRGSVPHERFARAGFATFCYDQIGQGGRIREVENFYQRYPHDSMLGVMVRDLSSALDALEKLPYVDPEKIYVAGYGLGAMIALHSAALDDRPAGYALVSPPPPFHLDTDIARTGGIARWAQRHMLMPRLGQFVGREERAPYDLDQLLAAMAPRPTLVVTPVYDRESPIEYMNEMLDGVKLVFGRENSELTHVTPEAYDHFDSSMQSIVVGWLAQRE